uniref:Uncharacterized protein n=1 Tax=Schizaphis graminum TaxID=13262 RepID=A0A2S2NIV9_SCHGA
MNFYCVCMLVDCRSRLTATECLSHRWMQKKKPKKMVRKSSSKKFVKQTEENTIQAPAVAMIETTTCTGQDSLLLPLETSKENLKELCSKSRSQSPSEITTVSPTVVQKDSKSSKTCGNDEDISITAEIATGKSMVTAPVPRDTDVTSSIPQHTAAITSNVPQHTDVTTSEIPQNTTVTTSSIPQITTVTTSSIPQNTTNTTSGISSSAAIDITPAIDIVQGGADRQRMSTTTWSQTTFRTMTNCSNNYRRASDVSYTFSNFRTSSVAAVSSNFLGQELRDLQTMMLGDRPEALQKDGASGSGSSLHKLLLNRQHLTAAVADRKPKFKFSSMNRDVPAGSPPPVSNLLYYMTAAAAAASSSSSASSSCRSAPHSKRASPEHELTSTREMLLKLFYGGSDTVAEPNLST